MLDINLILVRLIMEVEIMKRTTTITGIAMIAIGIVILFLTSQFDKLLSIEIIALGYTAGIILGTYGLFLCIIDIPQIKERINKT